MSDIPIELKKEFNLEDENEKKMLLYMAEGAELGDPCFKVLEDTGVQLYIQLFFMLAHWQ